MKIFPSGKDAAMYFQIAVGAASLFIFKTISDFNPNLAFVLGFICIVLLGIYFLITKKNKKPTNTTETRK